MNKNLINQTKFDIVYIRFQSRAYHNHKFTSKYLQALVRIKHLNKVLSIFVLYSFKKVLNNLNNN